MDHAWEPSGQHAPESEVSQMDVKDLMTRNEQKPRRARATAGGAVTSHSMNARLRGSAADAAERSLQGQGLSGPEPSAPSAESESSFAAEPASKGPGYRENVRVRDIMTADVKSCRPQDTLAVAAIAMNHGDCRFLPVADAAGRPVGVITDGDICILGATDHRPLRGIFVQEMMNKRVATCGPDTEILEVARLMRSHRIRHVPVVGDDGVLIGVVSLTDLILCAEERGERSSDPVCHEIAAAVREIAQKHPGGRCVQIRPFAED